MKGTTQENISNEVKELAAKKYGVDDTISFQVCFQLQAQSFFHARGLSSTCMRLLYMQDTWALRGRLVQGERTSM